MTPMTVFDTFGIVSGETNGGVVPLAYIVALVAMVFTAISYGRMTRVYPSAGSAYTYASETIHPNFGFVVGWSSLLDYLLLPMVNAVIARIYFESFFPSAPSWVFVLGGYVAAITALNYLSMKGTSRVNGILVVFQVVLIGAFLVLAAMALSKGVGAGTIFTLDPLAHEGVQMQAVVAGATVVCFFSFIGFDAITMYAEEAKSPDIVPRAIVLALLIGGAIFFAAAWFSQSVFPTLDGFEVTDDTLPEMALKVGGMVFKVFFVSAALAAVVASSLASHASVARMIYVMGGRNGRGRFGRFLSYIHPRFLTPCPRRPHRRRGVTARGEIHPGIRLVDDQLRRPHRIHGGESDDHRAVRLPPQAAAHPPERDRHQHRAAGHRHGADGGGTVVNLHFDALLYGGIWLAIGIAVFGLPDEGLPRPTDDADRRRDPDRGRYAGTGLQALSFGRRRAGLTRPPAWARNLLNLPIVICAQPAWRQTGGTNCCSRKKESGGGGRSRACAGPRAGGNIDPVLMDGVVEGSTTTEGKQTVLVVDDDARLRDLLCTVLMPLDCELVQAGSGEEALTALLQRKVSVIVLDINMPGGMGGFETAQLIREADELASTPIIFLTGQADDGGDLDRGYDLGAVDFLLKPVSAAVLYAKVKALLELDRSFARLRIEAAKLHEQQLQIARAAESRQREELALARRRARLATIFTEGSLIWPRWRRPSSPS